MEQAARACGGRLIDCSGRTSRRLRLRDRSRALPGRSSRRLRLRDRSRTLPGRTSRRLRLRDRSLTLPGRSSRRLRLRDRSRTLPGRTSRRLRLRDRSLTLPGRSSRRLRLRDRSRTLPGRTSRRLRLRDRSRTLPGRSSRRLRLRDRSRTLPGRTSRRLRLRDRSLTLPGRSSRRLRLRDRSRTLPGRTSRRLRLRDRSRTLPGRTSRRLRLRDRSRTLPGRSSRRLRTVLNIMGSVNVHFEVLRYNPLHHNKNRERKKTCGICGDAYNIAPPRPHELGGTYGLGLIVARYAPGALISTTVDLTTSHKGFWQFKLCPDPESSDQACFDKHVLETEDGEEKYYPTRGSGKYNVTYRLPKGVICDHCVLQWRYTAGNNWGICGNGSQGLGCGAQEQFGACSDISIGASRNLLRNDEENSVDDIPPPLLYYLKNGYFDAKQGVLHLLRGQMHPNKVGQNLIPNRQNTQRPTQSNQRPTSTNQRPTPTNQQPTRTNLQPTQVNPQRPVNTNQQRPIQANQQRPVQTNQRQPQIPQQPHQQKPTQANQQRPTQANQQRPTQANQKRPNQSNQKPHANQLQQNSRPGYNPYQNPALNLNHSLISQLDALIKSYRDQQKKQQNKSVKSVKIVPNINQSPQLPIRTIEITKHTVQSFMIPQGEFQHWKNGKLFFCVGHRVHQRTDKPWCQRFNYTMFYIYKSSLLIEKYYTSCDFLGSQAS
ncbi:lytic polysaccharide mono-oxygenase, cellulose-degrading domain-containing protein [Phthorimaea operculella]|nr:lytic polysaccharide mono-oxygenase, cellulose-degrading domain-containing protein [Phthorimaea operculella]